MNPDIKKTFLAALLIAILGFAVYANSLNGEFVWDDCQLIENNPYIKSFSRIPNILTEEVGAGSGREYYYYRPFEMFTHMVDYSLWKLNARGHHLTTTLFHILAALTVYWLVTVLYRDSLLSLFTGILFIVHPIHTEAVAYISGRIDLLATAFVLLCFIFYIKLSYERKIGFYVIVFLSYILALLSKESALIFPALLLLYHYTFSAGGGSAHGGKKINIKAFLPILFLASAYVILRVAVLKHAPLQEEWIATIPQRIPGIFVAITNYIRLLIFPFHLHAAYGGKLFQFTDPRALLGILILFSLLICAFRKRQSSALIFFSISWFFIALLPVSNIYPVVFYMAEHWLYLPSLGFFLILAKGMSFLYRRREFKPVAIVCLTGLLAFYSFLTIRQNDYWKDRVTFYERTLKYVPDDVWMHNNLGSAYNFIGEHEKAIASYKKAIEIDPNYSDSYNNLANTYRDIGKKEEAIVLYKKTMELDSSKAQVYNNLGVAYYEKGVKEEAIALFNKAIEINPNYTEAYNNLANAYYGIGKKEEAIAFYKKAIENDPDYYAEGYNNLGTAYLGVGRGEEAIAAFKKAIEINPDYTKAYNNLANAYFAIGEKEKAITSYKKAIEKNPDNAVAHNNLAMVYYVEKQYGLAIKHSDRAVKLGYKADPDFLKLLEQRRE